MTALTLNGQQYQPQYGGSGGLPAGLKYKGVIVGDEVADIQGGKGKLLVFEIQVIEGPLAGQKQYDRVNLWHNDPKVSESAWKQLTAYAHVTGAINVNADTAELYNKPFLFDVTGNTKNDFTNISKIYDQNGNEPGKAGGQVMQAAAPIAPPPPGFGAENGGFQPPPQQQQQPFAQPQPQQFQQPQPQPQQFQQPQPQQFQPPQEQQFQQPQPQPQQFQQPAPQQQPGGQGGWAPSGQPQNGPAGWQK